MVEFVQSSVPLAQSPPPRSLEPTNQEWVERYVQSKAKAAKTLRQYRYQLQWFVQWLGARSLTQTGTADIEQYRNHLHERGLADETIGQAVVAIRSWFEWAKAQGWVESNPARFVEVPRAHQPDPEAQDFSEAELAALYGALAFRGATEIRDRAIFALLEHGLRASEVCGLEVESFDPAKQRVAIRAAKHDSVGIVPLLAAAVAAIAAYLAERTQGEGEVLPQSPLFVATSNRNRGQRLGYPAVYALLKDLGGIAGVENCHPHRLRHTFAMRLVRQGMDSYLARKLTRHGSEKSFRRYTEAARQEAAEQQFRDLFGGT